MKVWPKYCILVFFVFLFYGPSLNFGFIWDDVNYIVNNGTLAQGTSLLNLWSFKHVNADFWPLTYSFFWILRQIFGLDTFYFHLANITLFLISVLLLYRLLCLLKIKNSFFISLIYSVHPMNVALAAWSFQAKTNLANIFGLASCIFIFSYFNSRKSKYVYAFSLILFLASLLSKISLIFLPVLFFTYVFLIKKENFKKSFLLIAPFFLVSIFVGIINILWDSGALPVPDSERILDPNYLNRLFMVGKNFLFYFYKTIFPSELMFSYARYEIDRSKLMDTLPFIFLILFLLYSVYKNFKLKKFDVRSMSLFLSFLILFPILGLVEIYYMRFSNVAEHYLNLGMIGFVIFLTTTLNYQKYKYIFWIWLCWCGFQTYKYLPEYKNEESLMLATVQKNPDAKIAHDLLGSFYKKQNDLDKALYHYKESIRIRPASEPYFNIGTVKERLNLFDEAISNYEISEQLNPHITQVYINIGVVYAKKQNQKVAIDYFKKVISKDAAASTAYYNIGYAYETLNNIPEAIKWYTAALQISPENEIYKSAVSEMKERR